MPVPDVLPGSQVAFWEDVDATDGVARFVPPRSQVSLCEEVVNAASGGPPGDRSQEKRGRRVGTRGGHTSGEFVRKLEGPAQGPGCWVRKESPRGGPTVGTQVAGSTRPVVEV